MSIYNIINRMSTSEAASIGVIFGSIGYGVKYCMTSDKLKHEKKD